jgi:alpha-mannosidase
VHLSPPGQSVLPSGTGRLVLTVACGPEPARGRVEIDAGPGLAAEPAGPLDYDLPALGHARWELTVRRRPGAAAGHQFVTAQIGDHAGQVIEDAVLITADDLPASVAAAPDAAAWAEGLRAITGELDLDLAPRQLQLAPGEAGTLEVTLASHAASELRGEVQLISPAGSWDFVPGWTAGFAMPAGGRARLAFGVRAPAAARPGQRWWVLAKVMYFGRARYSEPAEVTVK